MNQLLKASAEGGGSDSNEPKEEESFVIKGNESKAHFKEPSKDINVC